MKILRQHLPALALVLPLLISACTTATGTTSASPGQKTVPEMTRVPVPEKAQAVRLIGDRDFWPQADRLVSSRSEGLLVMDKQGKVLERHEGAFSAFDLRSGSESLVVVALDTVSQRLAVFGLTKDERRLKRIADLPRTEFAVEGVCLYRDAARSLFAFVVGEEGRGEQWLVAQQFAPLPQPLKVRRLSLPPDATHCHADDGEALLYVNEESAGVWAYPADAEAPLTRQPVDVVKPFGTMTGETGDVAAIPGGVLALDADAPALRVYLRNEEGWQAQAPIALAGLDEPEQISARPAGKGWQVSVLGEEGLAVMTLDAKQAQAFAPRAALPVVPALVQTEPVPGLGDAADDPAIWVHPEDTSRSRILATDKQGGLLVYDLQGRQLQDLRVGRINNVDLRSGFMLGGQRVDIAVGTNRDHDSLHVFYINRQTGAVREGGQIATLLEEIYGVCMFKDKQNRFYAIANGKDGTFLQYHLDGSSGKLKASLARRFSVGSQPEGCIADDRKEQLFVGEEKRAVWTLDARADAQASMSKVMAVGDHMHADIEGLAIYHGAEKDYLVISSQGNDSYVILEAHAPFAYRGAFRVGLNAALGIDGASETDGLDVTSANLGGPWSKGMLVVQDGRKRMPEANQNYKYVPWASIADALGLE